jgi:hypothetical protein
MVRSGPKERVSNQEAAPSFETRSFGPLLRMRRRETAAYGSRLSIRSAGTTGK